MDGIVIDTNTLVSRSADQVSSELEGEVIVLNIKTGKYFNLNAVGSRIWEKIEKPDSIASLLQMILGEYDVDEQKCLQDMITLISKLHQAGLVTVSNQQTESL